MPVADFHTDQIQSKHQIQKMTPKLSKSKDETAYEEVYEDS